MQDTHFRWMLVALLSLLLLIGVLFFFAPSAQPTAAPHPEFSSILQSTGPYTARDSWLGVVFGLLLIAVIAFTSTIGLYRTRARSKLNAWILRGLVVYGAVWILIKFVDGLYLAAPSPAFVGGFPLPTALLVYGIGVFPLVVIPLYYYYFSSDIFSEKDQEQFNALLKQNREETGGPK